MPRRVLEAVAVETYRSGVLTAFQVSELLGHSSRWETESFLKRAHAYLHYTEDDLEATSPPCAPPQNRGKRLTRRSPADCPADLAKPFASVKPAYIAEILKTLEAFDRARKAKGNVITFMP